MNNLRNHDLIRNMCQRGSLTEEFIVEQNDDELRNLANFFHIPTEKNVKIFETEKSFPIPGNGGVVDYAILLELRDELNSLMNEIVNHNNSSEDEIKELEILSNDYRNVDWKLTAKKKVFIERNILEKEVYSRSILVYNDFLKKKQQKENLKQEKKNNTIVRDGIEYELVPIIKKA